MLASGPGQSLAAASAWERQPRFLWLWVRLCCPLGLGCGAVVMSPPLPASPFICIHKYFSSYCVVSVTVCVLCPVSRRTLSTGDDPPARPFTPTGSYLTGSFHTYEGSLLPQYLLEVSSESAIFCYHGTWQGRQPSPPARSARPVRPRKRWAPLKPGVRRVQPMTKVQTRVAGGSRQFPVGPQTREMDHDGCAS